MPSSSSTIAIALGATLLLLIGVLIGMRLGRPSKRQSPLPTDWGLSARPVFSSDERRLYRLLREALPQYVILAKLPLVRLCQPTDPARVQYWFDLLGNVNAAFTICSANGRVLAAIDFDGERGGARRSVQIKQAVLAACRVRYLRCPVEPLPTLAELQQLVPAVSAASAGSQTLHQARDTLASTVATRRAQRSALWQDSAQFSDSFFAPDTRMEGFTRTEHGGLYGSEGRNGAASRFDLAFGAMNDAHEGEIGGVVVDSAPASRH